MTTPKLEELGREELLSTVRRLLAEAEALSSRIAAVNEIGIAVNRTFDLSEILRVVARQAKWLLDFDHCSVCLPGSDQSSWHIMTLFGPREDYNPQTLTTSANIGYVLSTGQSQLIRQGCQSDFLEKHLSRQEIILGLIFQYLFLGQTLLEVLLILNLLIYNNDYIDIMTFHIEGHV